MDNFDIVYKALGESEAVREAREALREIEAELSAWMQAADTSFQAIEPVMRRWGK